MSLITLDRARYIGLTFIVLMIAGALALTFQPGLLSESPRLAFAVELAGLNGSMRQSEPSIAFSRLIPRATPVTSSRHRSRSIETNQDRGRRLTRFLEPPALIVSVSLRYACWKAGLIPRSNATTLLKKLGSTPFVSTLAWPKPAGICSALYFVQGRRSDAHRLAMALPRHRTRRARSRSTLARTDTHPGCPSPLSAESLIKTLDPIVDAAPRGYLSSALALGLALVRNSRPDEGLALPRTDSAKSPR